MRYDLPEIYKPIYVKTTPLAGSDLFYHVILSQLNDGLGGFSCANDNTLPTSTLVDDAYGHDHASHGDGEYEPAFYGNGFLVWGGVLYGACNDHDGYVHGYYSSHDLIHGWLCVQTQNCPLRG